MALVISVITVTLNRVDTIGEALASLHSQKTTCYEHIIVDGGSTDGTLDVIRGQEIQPARLISERDSGLYDALNKGLALANGEVIGILHSDDFYAHDRVLERVEAIFHDSSIDAVYGDLEYVARDDPSRLVRRWVAGRYIPEQLALGWMPPHPTLFLRRSVVETWGGFDTRYRIAADYDAALRYIVKGGLRLSYIPEVLVKMRVGGESNRSLRRILEKSYEDFLILRRNKIGGFSTLMAKNLRKINQFFI